MVRHGRLLTRRSKAVGAVAGLVAAMGADDPPRVSLGDVFSSFEAWTNMVGAFVGPDRERQYRQEIAVACWATSLMEGLGLGRQKTLVRLGVDLPFDLKVGLEWAQDRGVGPGEWLASVQSSVDAIDRAEERSGSWFVVTEFLTRLYELVFERSDRQTTGTFHTPGFLADMVVDRLVSVSDLGLARPIRSVLDPGCGFGVFLVSLLQRFGTDLDIQGRDVSPLAVYLSRLVLLERLVRGFGWSVSSAQQWVMRAVRIEDVIVGLGPEGKSVDPCFDALVGNPPWVPWDRVSAAYRRRIRAMGQSRPYLFSETGFSAMTGGASDDLSSVFVALSVERHLRRSGVMAFLVKQTLFTNETGSALRALGRQGPRCLPLGVVGVEDLSDCHSLFGSGGQQTALMLARLGHPAAFPVPWRIWTLSKAHLRPDQTVQAVPINPKEHGSTWQVVPMGSFVGNADEADHRRWAYADRVRHGLKHDAEGLLVFDALERRKDVVVAQPKGGGEAVLLEPDCIFPYVKPRHIGALTLKGWRYVLVPQLRTGEDNEEELAERFPRTYEYLRRNRARLDARKSKVFRIGPFYNMFGLGPYTWNRYRVAWSGLGFRPLFVVLSELDDEWIGRKPPLVDGGCYSLALDSEQEAWYVAGLLNSTPIKRRLRLLASGSKRALGKKAISRLDAPAFDPDRSDMRHLSDFAHQAGQQGSGSEEDWRDELDRIASDILAKSARAVRPRP